LEIQVAQSAQERRQAQRRLAKKGANPIAGMGKLSRKVAMTRNGPKASETDQQQMGGKHHAPVSYASAMKNASGGDKSTGRHSRENYSGRHDGGHFNGVRDMIASGGLPIGRHARG
jgi:hypothetical protein